MTGSADQTLAVPYRIHQRADPSVYFLVVDGPVSAAVEEGTAPSCFHGTAKGDLGSIREEAVRERHQVSLVPVRTV
ncbi:hypothetical protein EDF31_1131 [Curtobacterium sp. PhB142]|nr:hypothetical protein EDF31_1131 [Curtobacterium sp. PhB142]TCL99713.1 hypothetical protein EDF26_11461 [Curtobacterium sp. PhB134]